MNKKNTIIMAVVIFLSILVVVGVSYAFFTAQITGTESESSIVTTSGSMNITYADNSGRIRIENIYPRATAWVNKQFTITGDNTTDTIMNYEIDLDIISNNFQANTLTYSLTNTKKDSGTAIANKADVPIAQSGSQIIGYGQFVNGLDQEHKYTLSVYFPNANTNQNNNQDKSFSAKITIKAANPYVLLTDTERFANKVGTSGNGSLYEDPYGNLRYDGKSPNNYATFNDENWRIIGVFELPKVVNGAASTTETEKRIKLIREESIGSAKYHASSNVWSTSLIATGLTNSANGTAYGDNGSGTNISFYLKSAAQSLISPAVWYVGASNNEAKAKDVYDTEHATSTSPWIGSMGLMSASDYGFASSSCKGGSKTLFYYDHSTCTGSNWLKKGIMEWTMIPYSGYANSALFVNTSGDVYSDVTNASGLRPTVYLNSNVQVSGTGTTGDRYTFS